MFEPVALASLSFSCWLDELAEPTVGLVQVSHEWRLRQPVEDELNR